MTAYPAIQWIYGMHEMIMVWPTFSFFLFSLIRLLLSSAGNLRSTRCPSPTGICECDLFMAIYGVHMSLWSSLLRDYSVRVRKVIEEDFCPTRWVFSRALQEPGRSGMVDLWYGQCCFLSVASWLALFLSFFLSNVSIATSSLFDLFIPRRM
jgi:hypothetical protein